MTTGLEKRRDDILDAASALLKTAGYTGLTTNALAAAAQCSKKTIYSLFPDKDSLLAALVTNQAAQLGQILETQVMDNTTERLEKIGAALIAVLLSETSIAINRAAIADPSGKLSTILRANGRDRFAPEITELAISALGLNGSSANPDELFQSFYGLLLGDRQVGALHGAPSENIGEHARFAIARRAVAQLRCIYSGHAVFTPSLASS